MRRLSLAVSTTVLIAVTSTAAPAQVPTLYVRHPSPHYDRQLPIPEQPQPGTLTSAQKLAIAPVRFPAVWPAPKVPAGTIPVIPPRPDWQPQPGEYWGPFTDGTGAWGFMVGPMPATRPNSSGEPPLVIPARIRLITTAPAPAAPLPTAPVVPLELQQPVAGPVSPEGRVVVTYPDGKRVTWQFPMFQYTAHLVSSAPNGSLTLVDQYGHRASFTLSHTARITLNGHPVTSGQLPPGAAVQARALQLAPTELTLITATK
jgi:hypothetical protein